MGKFTDLLNQFESERKPELQRTAKQKTRTMNLIEKAKKFQNDNKNTLMPQGVIYEDTEHRPIGLEWQTELLGRAANMQLSLELIDIKTAERLIKMPLENQRGIRAAHVKRLTEAMNNDEYIDDIINPIYISDTGKLMDGQHRLRAVINSGKPQRFLVVSGLPEEIFVYIDENLSRAAKDALRIRGIRNPEDVATTTKLLFQLMHGKTNTPRHVVVDRMMKDYPDIEDAVAKGLSMKNSVLGAQPNVMAVLYFLYSRMYPENCEKFFHYLQYGGDVMELAGHPITRLKKKLAQEWKNAKGHQQFVGIPQKGTDQRRQYDSRYKIMCYFHTAFMAFNAGKKSFYGWDENQETIEDIGSLARQVINIRWSRKENGVD